MDQSAIPLIALSHQPYLYQNIQNLDGLLIGSFEMSNVSNALIGLQSEIEARDQDAGGLKVTKIKCKQSISSHVCFCLLEENWKYQMAVRAIAKVIRTFDGVEGISAEQKEGIVNYIQRKDKLAVLRTGYGKSLVITAVPVNTWYMQCVKEGR